MKRHGFGRRVAHVHNKSIAACYSDNSTSLHMTISTCRIQPLRLSHLHCNSTIFVGEICIVTKQILKKLFKE